MASTVRLHRVFATTPERVYRAFLDPAALVKWLPPYGFTATSHECDARVGGKHRMIFTNSAPAAHTASVANISSSFRTASCVTRTSSMIPICPAPLK